MAKPRTTAQYAGILLQPISYPPYYGKSSRFLKKFDFESEEEIVGFQERLRSRVDRQMDERWHALCAHYGIDPNGADRWPNLVFALFQNHEPQLSTPSIKLNAVFDRYSTSEFKLRSDRDEHWLLVAHLLAIKHVPCFSEQQRSVSARPTVLLSCRDPQ